MLRRDEMEEPFTFTDLLTWLSPLLVPLWLLGLWRVRRDLRRVSRAGPEVARCGLPNGPIGPSPLGLLLQRRRPEASRPYAA